MKFGTSLMGVRMRDYAEVASCFEEAGFESIWVPEHLAFPTEMPATYPYSDDGLPMVNTKTPCYDPWVVLAYVACATTTIRLATDVSCGPPARGHAGRRVDRGGSARRRRLRRESRSRPRRATRRGTGRDGTQFEVTVGSALAGDADAVRRARDAGATRVIAMPWRGGSAVSPAEAREWADRYADEVING